MSGLVPLPILAGLAAGLALGLVWLLLLRRSVRLVAGGGSLPLTLGLFVLRLALAASVLWVAAQAGAAPLLAVLAGFVIARTLMQRRLGEAL